MHERDDWQSEEMVRAEYGLDDAVERAYRDMHAADEVLAQVAANDERRAADLAELWRTHAHRADAPAAWRIVIAKVEAGELSWRDIATGAGADHLAVRAALAADSRPGDSRPGGDQPGEPSRGGALPARRHGATDEDSYYDEFTVLRKRPHRR